MQPDNYLNCRKQQRAGDETAKSFDPSYLAAKKSIDDRALNHHVLETLHQAMQQLADGAPLKILELGTGIGTMLERLVDWGILTGPSSYLATDMDPRQLGAARKRLSQWAGKHGHSWSWASDGGQLSTANADVSLRLEVARAEELADNSASLGPFHLIIAHAVLDLVDFPVVLPRLLSRLTDGGLAYFTCNFDGETVFLPHYEGEEEIMKRYHGSMEVRLTGASHTGRRLLTFAQSAGLEILAAGSSDWVIHPRTGGYSLDETFFLHAIIETIERELAKDKNPPSEVANLTHWARLRHQQIEAGELSFLARHLDLLVQYTSALP
ncbi:bifunctional 2-polyprenyl-6-hydroxyphenol methylase/3-demethylubiquinol 3-O-methyltransferase UbiG [Desulforhopalus sp. IMCC35007]|uniref:class I SAM-dependent methyltransferase n=1 Tax=Desulforhopalus sp. IMCC35007 TaxID=2569543 RepID=UPI00145EFEF3|nr:class I SAM-dependent methyltransferase [Desulforhopalus sp. IMCC35007]